MTFDDFIPRLQAFKGSNVFNPWADQDPMDVNANAPLDRIERLRNHLNCRPKLLLVGEAPGYQGCHFSGVAFTNEKLILDGHVPRIFHLGRLSTRRTPWSEPSATIVWDQLHHLRIAEQTVMWNAFAWHPHQIGNLYSNRPPTRQEIKAGRDTLLGFLELVGTIPIVPIGQVSRSTFQSMGVNTRPHLRHPSYGGATEFRDGLRRLVDELQLTTAHPQTPAEG